MIKKSDLGNLEQLALELDLPEPVESAGLDPEEVQRVSMAAMQALEEGQARLSPTDSGWFSDYLNLKSMGYSWRVAAYIAWEASPKINRWPATITDLAKQVLGLRSPRVIYTWRKKNATIDEVISVMQTAPLYEHRRDVIEALITVAADPDYKAHKDRKLFFEMIGDYTPRKQVDVSDQRAKPNDLSQMSDEELRKRVEVLKSDDQGPGSQLEIASQARNDKDGGAPSA